MLQNIRDRFTGPMVWGVVAMIGIPFAFVGIDSFRSGGGDPTVVKVGSIKITEAQVQRAYESRTRQLQEMMGENFRSDMIQPESFRKGVVDELVQEAVLKTHAKDAGYSASSAAILQSLQTIPAFLKDGKFDKKTYEEVLARQGYSAASFEQQMREGLSQDQVRDAVLGTAFITPNEAAAQWRMGQQERAFSYAQFKLADAAASQTASDAEVATYFAQHGSDYTAPERYKAQYVELALDSLPEAAAPPAAILQALYDGTKANYATPETRTASHILVNLGADKSAALKKAQELRAKIAAGSDFAELARANSDDAGSKAAGGSLGEVRKGQMTPKFEDALFALKADEVSQPIETEFGFHIIKLSAIKPAATRAFSDAGVQSELLAAYRKKDAETRFKDLSEKLEQLAFENAASLEPVAKALGGKVMTTEFFNRKAGSGPAAVEAFRTTAFSSDVLTSGENSKPVTLAPNHLAVLRKADYQAARPQKLEEVKDQVRSAVVNAKAKAALLARAETLLKALKAPGANFETTMQASGAALSTAGSVKRTATTVDAAILAQAFKMPRPTATAISYGQASLANGDVAVIGLSVVRDPVPSTADPEFQKESSSLKDALAGSEFAGYKAVLEKSVGVKRSANTADPSGK